MGRIREIKKQVRHKEWAAMVSDCQASGKKVLKLMKKFPIIKILTRHKLLKQTRKKSKGVSEMKGITTQQGRETLNRFKMEAASEVGVNLKQGYNGDLTSREAGSVGGQMVKKMIDSYKQQGRS